MLFKSTFGICGWVLLCLSTAVRAEPGTISERHPFPTAESVSISDASAINLQDAITRTFEHNPELNAFSYALKAQAGRQLQASMAASPEINVDIEDALGTGPFEGTDNAQMTLGIAWVLEGDVRRGYSDVALGKADLLSTQATIKRLDAAAETARLYIHCLAHQSRLNNALKTVRLAEQTVKTVSKRVAAGNTPAAELARARAELARQRLAHEDIEHELRSTIHQLAAQWGETQPDFTQVTGDIFKLPATPSFATLKTQTQHSPDFLRLMSEKRLLQAQLQLAESKSNPPWRVNLGLRHFETGNDQALVAGISLPFGERSRNTGNIIAARESLSQTVAQTNALKVRFETMLYVLTEELKHSLHSIAAYRDDILPQLEEALRKTQKAYELGRYSYLEWRSVQADVLNARNTLLENSVDAQLKVIEIERLTGVSMKQIAPPVSNKQTDKN